MQEPDFEFVEHLIRAAESKCTYRVREYSRPFKPDQPYFDGMNPYWVYCSGEIKDYYWALLHAIAYEKQTGIKTWVDCITTYEYFDND